MEIVCSLTGLATAVTWPSRRAPPFHSSEDSATEHPVELETQRQPMNVHKPDLPGDIQNLCTKETQEGRIQSLSASAAGAAVASPSLLFLLQLLLLSL